MASRITKFTVRLDAKDLANIQAGLAEYGCRSVSDFLRLAAAEKLQRASASVFIEEHMKRLDAHISELRERQMKLDSATSALLKMQEMNTQNAMETMQKTAENLAKIAAKIG